MNAPFDPAVVSRLQKEAATAALVRRNTRVNFPHFVRVPGKRRPVPTGWESHKSNPLTVASR